MHQSPRSPHLLTPVPQLIPYHAMAPQKQRVINLSAFRRKKASITDEEFQDYLINIHGPRSAVIQARHGALKVVQYHTPRASKNLILEQIPWAIQPGWELDDYDIIVSVYVPSMAAMEAIMTDAEFQPLFAGEAAVFEDGARMTAGWEEVFVEDGKVLATDSA
ncbi:EthD domain-containing protein, partial [Aspergillus homomorphus CBS 101889]